MIKPVPLNNNEILNDADHIDSNLIEPLIVDMVVKAKNLLGKKKTLKTNKV